MTDNAFPILSAIDNPADLRALSPDQLPQLSQELREYLLQSVAQSGGHFAAGLGTIELTIALHYVFNTPEDRLIWDVGHQCYPHKILTERKDRITSIRTREGLAPFPKRGESEYDTFGVGHSSTSISAGLGMALGAKLRGEKRKVVPIIGDGGLTAGMAYEALNHLGDSRADVLVILNDNEMSISPNVGAMSKYLTRMLSGRTFYSMREGSKRLLEPMPHIWEFAKRTEEHVKGMFVPGTLFEEMGVRYFGPTDGHDIHGLVKTLKNLRSMTGPRLLHVITRKGKGYERAEQDPVAYHAVSEFNPDVGMIKKASPKVTYTQVFSDWVCDIARQDERAVAITPAMREGSGLVQFSKQFPDRYYDVAIAEQHAVTLAAGLACEGVKPIVAIYSTFLQRAYDQLIHDVAIQNLPVVFAIDRAGVVGPDGQTHAGSFDLTYLRCIPNMLICAPSNENETRHLLQTAYEHDGPSAVRYPRGSGPGIEVNADLSSFEIGQANTLREGIDIAFLCFGSPTEVGLQAGERLNATVVDMRFVKPLDTDMIDSIAASHKLIVTLEDNVVAGGAGSAIGEYLNEQGMSISILNLGLPDAFQDHGSREELLEEAGLSLEQVLKRVQNVYLPGDCLATGASVVS